MGAHVKHEFAGRFVLFEEHIRKINEIVKGRVPVSYERTIFVRRRDSFAYSTTDVDQVCAEENGPSAEITGIDFASTGDELDFRLVFDAKEGAALRIQGDDRDAVFLLSNDIKAYVEHEVMTFRWLPSGGALRVLPLVLMTGVAATTFGYFALSLSSKSHAVTDILNSKDVNEKLNFLISSRMERVDEVFAWPFAGFFVFLVVLMSGVPSRLFGYLYPGSDFFIGKKSAKFAARADLRSKILWGVVIAGALGAITTWLFDRAR